MEKRGRVRDSYKTNLFSKSQASTEFIIILSFFLVVLVVLIGVNQDLMIQVGNQFRVSKAQMAVNDLGDAAEYVYSQGASAQTRVFISVPGNVRTSQISGQTITLTVSSGSQTTRDIYRTLGFPVQGSIPTNEGSHWIIVRAFEGYVIIGYSMVEIIPTGFTQSLMPGNSSLEQISIRNEILYDIDVILSYTGDPDIQVNLSQASLQLIPNQTGLIPLTIQIPLLTSPGLYSGKIRIASNSTTDSSVSSVSIVINVPAAGQCPGSGPSGSPASIVLYPDNWDVGQLYEGTTGSNTFYICNNLDSSQNVDLTFSNSTYSGFNSDISTKSKAYNIPPLSCNSTQVYINTSGGDIEQFSILLLADGGTFTDNSSISGEILPGGAYPFIALNYPTEGYESLSGSIAFSYTVTDADSGILNCALLINNTVNQTNVTIQEGVMQSFTVPDFSDGAYSWAINCTDDSASQLESGTAQRLFTVNKVIISFYATPALALEEDFDPMWVAEVQTLNDGSYAISEDEGSPGHPNYPPPDFVEFIFPDLGIGSNFVIDTVTFKVSHYENLTGGIFPDDDRHQVECFNSVSWVPINTWEPSTTWTNYTSPDLSSCISTYTQANNINIRVTYDPSLDTGALQYFDWAQVEVNVSQAYNVNLWELGIDDPSPVDFSSGLNSTANTFGINLGNDGWDWAEDPYGGALSSVQVNHDPNMDGSTLDSTVAPDDRIEIRIGGGAPGAPPAPDDGTTTGPLSSGAYGVQFEILTEHYNAIAAGGSATLSFEWVTDEDAGYGDNLDAEEEAWIKSRLITPTQTIWLGSDLDGGDDDADSTDEIWFSNDPVDTSGNENIDITSYITSAGTYYLDLGAMVGGWSAANEGFGAYFDNIVITVTG